MKQLPVEEQALVILMLRFRRHIIPHHEKTLTHNPNQIKDWKAELKDSLCLDDNEKKCSIRCEWFSWCDGCDKPFCILKFIEPIDSKKVYLCRETGETLCEDCHISCGCYGEEYDDSKLMTCGKCGFKTDSKIIMNIHACRPQVLKKENL